MLQVLKITIVEQIMSSPLITIDAISSVEEAADVTTQNKVRHWLVVEDEDITKSLGIITPIDFICIMLNVIIILISIAVYFFLC
jgi:CBS domain-containing protein